MMKIAKHIGMLAAALALVGPAQAALVVTLDVRIAGGGGKNAVVANPGDVVNMELWASVVNGDSNNGNDGFLLAHGNMLSLEAGGLQGNLSPMTFNSPFIDATFSQVGTPNADLDPNADLEVGSTNPSAVAGFIVASTGVTTKFGSGNAAGPTEFLLGTFSWTATNNLAGVVDVNFQVRPKTDGTVASRQLVKVTSDGAVFNLLPTDIGDEIAIGSAVSIAVPEPTSAALVVLGSLGLFVVRRRSIA